MIGDLLDLIDRYPFESSLILAFGYSFGALCNYLFMRLAEYLRQDNN